MQETNMILGPGRFRTSFVGQKNIPIDIKGDISGETIDSNHLNFDIGDSGFIEMIVPEDSPLIGKSVTLTYRKSKAITPLPNETFHLFFKRVAKEYSNSFQDNGPKLEISSEKARIALLSGYAWNPISFMSYMYEYSKETTLNFLKYIFIEKSFDFNLTKKENPIEVAKNTAAFVFTYKLLPNNLKFDAIGSTEVPIIEGLSISLAGTLVQLHIIMVSKSGAYLRWEA